MTDQGMTVRRAALVVMFSLTVTTVGIPIAEFVVWPSLIDSTSIEQTVSNIRANEGAFLFASFAYLAGFIGDVVVAWGLYYLLRPVSRSLAALAAGFRAVQAIIAIGAALNLFTAFRLLKSESLAALGIDHLHAQVLVLLSSFRYEWSLALVIFGIHLGLLGYLMIRSSYIPRLVGIALAIAGIGYIVYNLRPYLYPDAEIGFVFATYPGELVFVLWLAIWGWRVPDPIQAATRYRVARRHEDLDSSSIIGA
jgi:hypothetical protein